MIKFSLYLQDSHPLSPRPPEERRDKIDWSATVCGVNAWLPNGGGESFLLPSGSHTDTKYTNAKINTIDASLPGIGWMVIVPALHQQCQGFKSKRLDLFIGCWTCILCNPSVYGRPMWPPTSWHQGMAGVTRIMFMKKKTESNLNCQFNFKFNIPKRIVS